MMAPNGIWLEHRLIWVVVHVYLLLMMKTSVSPNTAALAVVAPTLSTHHGKGSDGPSLLVGSVT